MSFEPDVLQGFVQRYLDTVAGGKADDVAALYAEDATLEDPVGGGEVHIGRQAIAGFYKVMEGGEIKTERDDETRALVRPWTWGRSVDAAGDVEEWMEGVQRR